MLSFMAFSARMGFAAQGPVVEIDKEFHVQFHPRDVDESAL